MENRTNIYYCSINLLRIQGILRLGAGGLRIKIQQCVSYLTGVSSWVEREQREGINDLATSPRPGVPSSSSSFCFLDEEQVCRVSVPLVGSEVGEGQAVNEAYYATRFLILEVTASAGSIAKHEKRQCDVLPH